MEVFGDFRLFEEGTVISELESSSKTEALKEIIRKASVFKYMLRQNDFTESVLNRERIQSTGIGHGIAVAHGKTEELDRIKVALGISRPGIEYDSIDGIPVHFIFVVANPPGKQFEYLMILSALVRMVRDEPFRRNILECCRSVDIENTLMRTLHGILAGQALPQHA